MNPFGMNTEDGVNIAPARIDIGMIKPFFLQQYQFPLQTVLIILITDYALTQQHLVSKIGQKNLLIVKFKSLTNGLRKDSSKPFGQKKLSREEGIQQKTSIQDVFKKVTFHH